MPRKKKPETLEELYAEKEKAREELRKAKQKEKILCNQISKLTRNARTHRHCTRGAMLETNLPSLLMKYRDIRYWVRKATPALLSMRLYPQSSRRWKSCKCLFRPGAERKRMKKSKKWTGEEVRTFELQQQEHITCEKHRGGPWQSGPDGCQKY